MPPKKTPGGGGNTPGKPGDGKPPLKSGDIDASTSVSGAHTKIEDKLSAGRGNQGEGTTPGKGQGNGQPRDTRVPPDGVTFDDPKRPNLGSDGKYYLRPGDKSVVIDDPKDFSRTITDIDNPDTSTGVLWEEKSATNATDVNKWVDKQVVKKIEAYIEARQHISGYENAPVGIQFTSPGADPAFRAAVDKAIADMRIKHPGVDIRVEWAQ